MFTLHVKLKRSIRGRKEVTAINSEKLTVVLKIIFNVSIYIPYHLHIVNSLYNGNFVPLL